MFQVAIREESFSISSSGAMTGQIWIEGNNNSFPHECWSDFPVIIVSWWLRELFDFETGRKEICELLFMDGPYMFAIHPGPERSLCRIECVDRGQPLRDGEWGDFDRDEVKSAIVQAAHQIVSFCRTRDARPNEIDSLTFAIDRLQQ